MSGVLIFGAGGHAKVVADILCCQGVSIRGFLDDDPQSWGTTRLGIPVLGGIDAWIDHAPDGLVIGIGSNSIRRAIVARLGDRVQNLWRSAIHPRATIAESVRLGHGVVVAAHAVLNPDSVIGDHAIINTSATVDHDCTIGAYVHIAPGVHLGGGVRVDEGTLIGIGSSVIPYRTIGSWAVIGAGAAVVTDIPDKVTAKGVPARWS